jgi:penicillin-binding protein 1B
MTIEITSVRNRSLAEKLRHTLHAVSHPFTSGKHRYFFSAAALLIMLTLAAAAITLFQSYRFYSAIIDARLASGYLTSRPGIYAAPRSLSVGQKVSQPDLIAGLRRAGYTESSNSDVWSGGFSVAGNVVSIRPNRIRPLDPLLIKVEIGNNDRLSSLTGDEVTLDSFTLEAENLTNDLHAKNGERTQLTYSELPPVLVHAILSIEDRRFFEHRGLDPFGVLRALLRNVGDDRIGQGGSTITQQLVKNTYLSSERTYQRKYAEAMLAFALERRLSKEDIFALYCNEIYLGQRGAVTVRGVEQAARIYFGKDVKDLTLPEAATIAGMIQGPTRYAPERHPDVAQGRRNTVLGVMIRDGWITLNEAATAAREPMVVAPLGEKARALAPWFVDYVNRVAQSQSPPDGEDHGRVFTTIDLDLQNLAEDALQRQLSRLQPLYQGRGSQPQAALVALDPRNGNVLAMVGGSNYAESQLNRATDAQRQPGSTFKPFVYAAALESGMSPGQMFADAPREFHYDKNKVYRPVNYGGGFSMRDVTMRTGLVKSLNVVTVDVAMQAGLAHVANLAEQFGLPKPERYPSLALGTTEVTPLQLAAAYAAFVNGGTRVEPRVIAGLGSAPPASTSEAITGPQVIKPTTAFMITNMLAAVIDHGTARAAHGAVKGTAIAGKTGTSRDGWFVGYTPSLVCAVWIGFDDNEQLGLTGAAAALPAWTEFIKGAVALRPSLGGRNFLCPEGIRFVETDADTGLLSTLSCPNRELIAITDALAPNMECYAHGNLPNMPEPEAQAPAGNSGPRTAPNRVSSPDITEPLLTKRTRVDVDERGRRTLVNAMR